MSASFVPAEHNVVLKQGRFDPPGVDQLSAIFSAYEAYAASTDNPVLVAHFHGGLVSAEVAESGAQTLYDACYAGRCFPVFFIWESGFTDVLKNNLPEVFEETIFKRLLMLASEYVVAKLKQTGFTRGPILIPESPFYVAEQLNKLNDTAPQKPADAVAFSSLAVNRAAVAAVDPVEQAQIQRAVEQDLIVQAESAKIINGLLTPAQVAAQKAARGPSVQGSTHTLMSPSITDPIRNSPGTSGTRGYLTPSLTLRIAVGAVKIVTRVVSRFIDHRDHGVQTTIVEEILREFYLDNVGKFVWGAMKDYTADAFGDSDQCGGSAFLAKLKALNAQNKLPKRIVLAGHSAGSIYICNFLKKAAAILPSSRFEVVFLAPAVNFELLAATLKAHGKMVSHVRVFAMSDANEHGEFLLDVPQTDHAPFVKHLYAGSLLYFVSAICEGDGDGDKPIAGMQRYYSGQPPFGTPDIETVANFLKDPPVKQVWSITTADAPVGYQCSSVHHGGFPDDPETQASLKQILTAGF